MPAFAGASSFLIALTGFVVEWPVSRRRSSAASSSKNRTGGLILENEDAAPSARAPPGVRFVLFAVVVSMLVEQQIDSETSVCSTIIMLVLFLLLCVAWLLQARPVSTHVYIYTDTSALADLPWAAR